MIAIEAGKHSPPLTMEAVGASRGRSPSVQLDRQCVSCVRTDQGAITLFEQDRAAQCTFVFWLHVEQSLATTRDLMLWSLTGLDHTIQARGLCGLGFGMDPW